MACTILTVPFDLVENKEGDFLKKGFIVDQQLQKFFGDPKHHTGYLYAAKFKEDIVRKASIKNFLQLQDSAHFNIKTELDSDYSFVDRKKYANSIEGHCVNKLETRKSETPSIDYLTRLLDKLRYVERQEWLRMQKLNGIVCLSNKHKIDFKGLPQERSWLPQRIFFFHCKPFKK